MEQAKEIAENFRAKREEFQQKGARRKGKEDDVRSSSRSSEDTVLENLSENSRYTSLDSFQTVIREKIVDIKVSCNSETHKHLEHPRFSDRDHKC